MQPINDWGTAIVSALALALSMITTAIPKVLGFAVILIVGWLIAWAIGAVVLRLLRAIRFNDLSQRSGFSTFVGNMGIKADTTDFVAEAAKWFVRLIFLVVAFDALGLPAVSQVFNQVIAWLPNLIVALVVLIIGGVIANAAYDVVRGSAATSGLGNPNFLAALARYGVLGFAIVAALNQIGIAATLVNALFIAFVGALALAFGLAFGLGGREMASEMWREWYLRGREVARNMPRTPPTSMPPGGNGERAREMRTAERSREMKNIERTGSVENAQRELEDEDVERKHRAESTERARQIR